MIIIQYCTEVRLLRIKEIQALGNPLGLTSLQPQICLNDRRQNFSLFKHPSHQFRLELRALKRGNSSSDLPQRHPSSQPPRRPLQAAITCMHEALTPRKQSNSPTGNARFPHQPHLLFRTQDHHYPIFSFFPNPSQLAYLTSLRA